MACRKPLRNTGKATTLLLAFGALCVSGAATAPSKPTGEACGWLVGSGDDLVVPLDPRPLATPPAGAKAAYCIRATILTQKGDERLLRFEPPLVIRSGERESMLERAPSVLFPYHRIGERYLRDKIPDEK